ncbi:MAG TPA: hypothetical protein VHB79_37790 [Polyangiaceae bacterium]|nr:hypothetical protein [Polyangiaceae bacterium]
MAFSRRLGVIGILGASWLVAVGCGSDDNKQVNTGDAGEAGESAGGKASSGGSTSNAGKGGNSTAGKGGSGGVGGKNAGGTGGTGGATAGSGGTNVVEAGQGGVPTAMGGAGGAPDVPSAGAGGDAAGAGGVGVPAVHQACANQCEMDDDCAVDGAAFQMICDPTSKRCVDPTVSACQTVDDCVANASFWSFFPCASNDECDGGKCIDWQGSGYCAYTPDPDCLDGDLKITLGQFGLPDSPIEVCYTPSACVGGVCQFACESLGCGAGAGDTCSPTTHECECTTGGAECSATGVCGADHHCTECKVDDDCAGANLGLDKCVDGKCGCSGAEVCPDPTANATPVCE